ncbi:CBS domain-containing protein [Amphritea sp. 2_MG-2023]|uniref:CBS domain-containing protein n=1 Tax=Amphritea TaxID=515417 RepID=UPI001C0749CE|nr:CBS domain-containing protein [Amphritea sp. 2_MG-2023]MBU2964539.1 CBS domain-containing protein [Amphritea atlantica]MDO6417868.1 CBS domain-containing protein [Amphritea sp. 2_MG-2023]
MPQEFYPLRLQDNCEVEHLLTPDQKQQPFSVTNPAIEVMTDFSAIIPITVTEGVSVDDALERMKSQHVRMLFVITLPGKFVGVISAQDIADNKVILHMQNHGVTRDEVSVGHIMLHKQYLRSLTFDQVNHSRVGDIMLTLKNSGDQHLLVVDETEIGIKRIRGIISASDVSRKLRVGFDTMYEAKSFAEIEKIITQGNDRVI